MVRVLTDATPFTQPRSSVANRRSVGSVAVNVAERVPSR